MERKIMFLYLPTHLFVLTVSEIKAIYFSSLFFFFIFYLILPSLCFFFFFPSFNLPNVFCLLMKIQYFANLENISSRSRFSKIECTQFADTLPLSRHSSNEIFHSSTRVSSALVSKKPRARSFIRLVCRSVGRLVG